MYFLPSDAFELVAEYQAMRYVFKRSICKDISFTNLAI